MCSGSLSFLINYLTHCMMGFQPKCFKLGYNSLCCCAQRTINYLSAHNKTNNVVRRVRVLCFAMLHSQKPASVAPPYRRYLGSPCTHGVYSCLTPARKEKSQICHSGRFSTFRISRSVGSMTTPSSSELLGKTHEVPFPSEEQSSVGRVAVAVPLN